MQDAVPELIGASLVLATRYGLDQPQPVVDTEALAALVNVPTGKLCHALQQQLVLSMRCRIAFLCFAHQVYTIQVTTM